MHFAASCRCALLLGTAVAMTTLAAQYKDISQGLPDGSEPSGLQWHNNQIFLVSDEGQLISTDEDGKFIKEWDLNGADVESVTAAPHRPDHVYVGLESDEDNYGLPVIYEVDTRKSGWTREFWLPGDFPASESKGMEALVFVPDASRPRGGGYFLGGSQDYGSKIFVYEADINIEGSDKITEVGKSNALGGNDDLSDMAYDNGKLYFLFDSDRRVIETDAQQYIQAAINGKGNAGLTFKTFKTDESDYEGLTFNDKYAFIGVDSGRLLRYPKSAFSTTAAGSGSTVAPAKAVKISKKKPSKKKKSKKTKTYKGSKLTKRATSVA